MWRRLHRRLRRRQRRRRRGRRRWRWRRGRWGWRQRWRRWRRWRRRRRRSRLHAVGRCETAVAGAASAIITTGRHRVESAAGRRGRSSRQRRPRLRKSGGLPAVPFGQSLQATGAGGRLPFCTIVTKVCRKKTLPSGNIFLCLLYFALHHVTQCTRQAVRLGCDKCPHLGQLARARSPARSASQPKHQIWQPCRRQAGGRRDEEQGARCRRRQCRPLPQRRRRRHCQVLEPRRQQ